MSCVNNLSFLFLVFLLCVIVALIDAGSGSVIVAFSCIFSFVYDGVLVEEPLLL